MADLAITAANVVPQAGATLDKSADAGVAITAGQVVYKDVNSKWQLANAITSATTAAAMGMACNNAAANQPLVVCTAGPVQINAGTLSLIYIVSGAVSGNVAPSADLASTWFCTILGVITAANILTINIYASGAVHA